ncbi:hypothetical protein Micbo1qcDRAFT_200725 [Microdochium bolleyi]|uniref:Cell wall proline rich protein n=1 Tax=Microdochium bolleyi TaxID=196109 RepID=A0A136JDU1_9PEZI|nr:hypothetical protein Micbo1qcDRAFT_200725 [Microdochium bolleyi]
MATIATDSNLEIAAGGRPGETSTRNIRIPAPIRIDNAPCPDSRSPFGTSPDLSLPPPNPEFVFPARQGPSSAPSSYSRATGRRTRSAFEPADRLPDILQGGDRSPRPSPGLPDFSFNPGATLAPGNPNRQTRSPTRSPALPDFSFNPGANLDEENGLLSPPKTPQSPRMPPNRHGHRRGASEFVGGKLRAGESITVMSTSPTKSESGFASPLLKPTEPPARRRGHQHRRSAAISQHDLTMILKPNNNDSSRGSSAPTSPVTLKPSSPLLTVPVVEPSVPHSPTDEPSTPLESMSAEPEVLQEAAEPKAATPPKAAPRARVGFSDTLEFIPRPLSLVSTDTTSTVTTIRPGGHSASNSISSLISLGSGVMSDREAPNLLSSATSGPKTSSRPSTAGAVLENTPSSSPAPGEPLSPRRRNSIPLLTGLAQDDSVEPAATTPIKTPKRWSFFGLDPFTGSGVPGKARPQSAGSNESGTAGRVAEAVAEPDIAQPGPATDEVTIKKSSGKKKKQKKVRAWGSSILTRKGKSRSGKTIPGRRRSLTPPPPRVMYDEEVFEDDLEDLPPFGPMSARSFPAPTHKAIRPRSSSDDEASYQMIDLDAALGPFNTPTYNAEWEAAQRTGQPPRRPLHSAAGMRGFSGPGMHYHRRAESAPTLPPFEGKFGISRFGSSSTMADVFEEDEEDDVSDTTSSTRSITISSDVKGKVDYSSASEHDSAETPTQERDLGILSPVDSASASNSVKRKGSGSSLDLQPPGSRMRTEIAGGSLHDFVIVEEEAAPSLRPVSATSSQAAPSPRRILPNRDLALVDVNSVSLPPPSLLTASPYSMNHSSAFPSPRSPMSDAHRISTAPSSIADENSFQSLLMGEPGPEIVRISIDVPSLTSSNSTMTRDSTFLPPVRPRGKPFQEQRPASFTSTAFGRRRSSLASLSRLISSAHGERSKLSEEVAVEDEPEQKQKASRAKRISRMMQFWKSKQPAES